MKNDVVKFGIGVAIGWLLYKAIKLVWVAVTIPVRLVMGHTNWYN